MNENEVGRWVRAIILSLIIFLIFSSYLFIRRGYYDLYIANKTFASSAVIIAGITLLIGPLSKRLTFLSELMTIRRELGLSAFGLALIHIIASLWQQDRFPFPERYLTEWIPAVAGIIAIVTWGYMAYISRNKKIQEMGAEPWKRRLSLFGWIGFIAILFHLTVMKHPGWIRWFNGQIKPSAELANPSYPPASLFVFLVMLVVIAYRLINTIYKKMHKRG